MSARFLLVVLLAGLCGLWLLSMRQQRIVLIHDMSVLHRQLTTDRAKLWKARASAMHQEVERHHDEP